ncbi:MAG: hypothetical protein R3D82_05945 [Xanthobacteraceae bacterium]
MIFKSIASLVLMTVRPRIRTGRPDAEVPLFYGFVTRGLDAAFEEACRRLKVTQMQTPQHSLGSKSAGGRIRFGDGSLGWLKVSGVPVGTMNPRRQREASPRVRNDIPTPQVFRTIQWTSKAIRWQATTMSLVVFPTVDRFLADGGSLAGDDEWIARLRTALSQIAALTCSHHCMTQEYVAHAILPRFGPDAPHVATEWHTAHGDLSWGNLTAPELFVLDWESWGLAPRAYDAAYLTVHSMEDVDLMLRLEQEFADEFSSSSGCVGLLVACAEMLNRIEAEQLDAWHARNIEAIAQRGLHRYRATIASGTTGKSPRTRQVPQAE